MPASPFRFTPRPHFVSAPATLPLPLSRVRIDNTSRLEEFRNRRIYRARHRSTRRLLSTASVPLLLLPSTPLFGTRRPTRQPSDCATITTTISTSRRDDTMQANYPPSPGPHPSQSSDDPDAPPATATATTTRTSSQCSSQESQLLHLSRVASMQEKLEGGSRKRTADGAVKGHGHGHGHSRTASAVSVSTSGSRIGEVGSPCLRCFRA